MRRVTRGVLAVAGLVGLGMFGPAGPGALAVPPADRFAAPAPTTPANTGQAPAAGKPVCTVADPQNRLIELSGLVATPTGYWAVNDSSDIDTHQRVFRLDKACKVNGVVQYSGAGPNDPEDLALGRDGTVWVADIGDNGRKRPSIALWKVPANGNGQATLFRMRYPDGAKFDAEALLLDANDQPIIVTRGAEVSSIFALKEPLSATSIQGVLLQKVGEFKPQRTTTDSALGPLKTQVTGGANSPDRKKVVLRTYSDAYEWDVPDGDVVKAITTGTPRITPLPDEPWGEAITYSNPDGATFLTVSETANLPGDPKPPAQILQYTPANDAKPAPTAGPPAGKRDTLSWYERLTLDQITSLVAAVGAFGVLLVIAGVVGILHARRSRASTARAKRGGDAPGAPDGAPAAAAATPNLASQNSGGQVYQAGGAGYRPGAGGSDEPWRRPGPGGTEYGTGRPAGGVATPPGYGPADPHGYGPPHGHPPTGR